MLLPCRSMPTMLAPLLVRSFSSRINFPTAGEPSINVNVSNSASSSIAGIGRISGGGGGT